MNNGTKITYREDSSLCGSSAVLPLCDTPLLSPPSFKFSKAQGCRSVLALRPPAGLPVLHCEFDKQRQCSNSSCNELGAFLSFLLCYFLLAHPSFCYRLVCITGTMDAIVSLLLCSHFIWFCLFSLLTNYCLRGKKCFEPLSQSDLFWCSGCSFIKSSSLLAVTAPSKFLISTKLLFTTVGNTERDHRWQQDWIKQLTSLYSEVLVSWGPNSGTQWKAQSRVWTREWEHLTGKGTTGYLSCTEAGKIQSTAASLDQ